MIEPNKIINTIYPQLPVGAPWIIIICTSRYAVHVTEVY
jgi:hypothetical protein